MKHLRFTIIFGIAAAVILVWLAWPRAGSAPTRTAPPAAINDIVIQKPNLVVHGRNLARVEVWAIPTGTNVTADSYQKLGDATLAETSRAGMQEWTLPIPERPLLITELFAQGFDASNASVGRVSAPQTGASALYDALWGEH